MLTNRVAGSGRKAGKRRLRPAGREIARAARFSAGCIALGLAFMVPELVVTPGFAQISTARLFSRTLSEVRNGCSVVQISFTSRVQYQSHFPFDTGDELLIKIRIAEPDIAASELERNSETANVPKQLAKQINQIEIEFGDAGAIELRVRFRKQVAYAVAQGKDLTSIVVAFHKVGATGQCLPRFDIAAGPPAALPEAPADPVPDPVPDAEPAFTEDPSLTDADRAKMQNLVTEARAALTAGENRIAVSLLTKAGRIPRNALSPEAQELLGVARERNQQLAHAKAEYEAFLEKYPNSPNAPRVKQRLAALLTAGGSGRRRDGAAPADLDAAPGEGSDVEIKFGGSITQQYLLDNTVRTVTDEFFGSQTESDINQSELQTNIDLFADFSWGSYEGELRFSGAHTLDFTPEDDSERTVSELFMELRNTEMGVGLRVGRQNRHTGGILGRFDGGLLLWEVAEGYELAVVGGFPVVDKARTPVTDTTFIGAAVEVSDIVPGFDATVYAIGQRTSGLDDRRAVGFEGRYFDTSVALFGGIEYDLFFDSLNNVYVNGSYTFPDRSTLSLALNYRNAPALQTLNALQGQPVSSLDELKALFSDEDIYDLARDRTARSTSGTISYTRPFNEKFQGGLDATVAHFSSTETSGGVLGTPSTGIDYFLSARLTGSGLIKERDLVTGILRFSDTSSSRRYRADLRTRYPVTRKLRVSPSIGAEYRTGVSTEFTERALNGKIGFDYSLFRNVHLEAEIGGRYSWRDDVGSKSRTFDSFAFIGYRIDF